MKRERAKLLKEQNNRCALCHYAFSIGQSPCYDKETHSMICRPCVALITAMRSSKQMRDVTYDMIDVYEERRSRLEV